MTIPSGYTGNLRLRFLAYPTEGFLREITGLSHGNNVKTVALFAQSLFWFVLLRSLEKLQGCMPLCCEQSHKSTVLISHSPCLPPVESCIEETGIWLSKSSQTLTTSNTKPHNSINTSLSTKCSEIQKNC